MPPIEPVVRAVEEAAPVVKGFFAEGGAGAGLWNAIRRGAGVAARDSATDAAPIGTDILPSLEFGKAPELRPGLEQWSHDIAAKLNVGQVTREQFDSAIAKFEPAKQELAGAFLTHSLSNASDTTLMANARSVGSQLRKELDRSGFNVGKFMQGDSPEWKHVYTLTADSPGNFTGYITRKAMNVEAGIREFSSLTKDFQTADKSGWPIVLTDDLSKATPDQLKVLSALSDRGDKILNLNVNDFDKGVNFMDFAKGTVHEKLSALVDEATMKAAADSQLASLSAKDLAREVLSGDADRAAKAIGAKVIRPEPIAEADLFKPPVTPDDVMRHFTSTYKNPADRDAAALIVKDTATYYDFKTMAQKVQDLRAGIVQELGTRSMKADGTLATATPDQIFARGTEKEKDLLFVVGVDGGKDSANRAASSSAMMNHLYATMNDVPSSQIVALPQLKAMQNAGLTDGKTIVYLDDAANEGVQINKRMRGDLNSFPDVMVGLIGSYKQFATSFNREGRTLIQTATYLPLKPGGMTRAIDSVQDLIAKAKTPQEAAQWEALSKQFKDRANLLGQDGGGTFSISAHQIWPYFTADSATNSVRNAATSLLKIGNPRDQRGYW